MQLQDFESNNELKTKVIAFLEEVMHDPELLTQERKAAANIIRYCCVLLGCAIKISSISKQFSVLVLDHNSPKSVCGKLTNAELKSADFFSETPVLVCHDYPLSSFIYFFKHCHILLFHSFSVSNICCSFIHQDKHQHYSQFSTVNL